MTIAAPIPFPPQHHNLLRYRYEDCFTLLAAFIPKKEVVGIFGKDLFEDRSLSHLLRELLGIEGVKPFECVGTPEEVKLAFKKVSEKGEFDNDFLMKIFSKKVPFGD